MNRFFVFALLLVLSACAGVPREVYVPHPGTKFVDYILVEKSKSRMYLLKSGKVVKQYYISLGFNPTGHKQQEGDGRTPEGFYTTVYKNPHSKYYRSIKISYPSVADIESARLRGVKPGGEIMIHGQPSKHFGPKDGIANAYDWTEGCIAVTNYEMGDIWEMVDVDTQIEIRP